MIGAFKKLLDDRMGTFSGDKDFLEGVCAACALVASANGIKDEEVDATAHAIASNPTMARAFKPREIEQVANEMLKRAGGGRMGRQALYKEIEEVGDRGDPEKAEAIVLAALDVAEAEGGIDEDETKVLERVASMLNVDLKKAMDA